MDKDTVKARVEEIGIIPALRLSSADDALFAAEAVHASGIPIVEITMTIPGAVDVVKTLAARYPDLIVGAGTLWDLDTARRCLDAGAKFLTSTGLDLEIVEFAVKNKVLVFPGVMTPTEIATAWKAGAAMVKVFPCVSLGGPAYIKALKSPFPDVPLIASGGVDQHTIKDFILEGAAAVGIGRDLVQPDAVKNRERGWIRELARRYMRMVKEARAQIS